MTILGAEPDVSGAGVTIETGETGAAEFFSAIALVSDLISRKSILHFGHLPGLWDFTSGCIGQA